MSLVKIAAAKWREVAKNILNKDKALLNDTEKRFLSTIDTSSHLSGGVKGIGKDQLWSKSVNKQRTLHQWAAERVGLTQANQSKNKTLKFDLAYKAAPYVNRYKTPDPKRLP